MPVRVFWFGFLGICIAIVIAGSLFGPGAGAPAAPADAGGANPAVVAFVLALYFGPALLAWQRYDPRAGRIFLFNLLIGWTLVGWLIVMVMALLPPRAAAATPPEPALRLPCLDCAEPVLPAARLCRHCRQPLPRDWADGAEVVELKEWRAE